MNRTTKILLANFASIKLALESLPDVTEEQELTHEEERQILLAAGVTLGAASQIKEKLLEGAQR